MFRFFRKTAPTPKPLRERALAALDAGDYEWAEAAFTQLLAADAAPGERAFLFNKRGVARIGLGRREQARSDFTSALACRPRYAPTLANLGNLLLEEARLDDAIAHYEAAIEADPSYAVAYVNLAAARKRTGQYAEAVRALRQAYRIAKGKVR
jgi:tetratricopeptide (TPR) repeat protein